MDSNHSEPAISARIEARLFSENAPVALAKLEKQLGISSSELAEGLSVLGEKLIGTGLALVHTETEAALAISSVCSREIEESYAAELERDIGEAGLEVLSIVLYRGPSTRTDIEYIRGVNSSSTMRTLLQRGLIERAPNPKDAREYLYRPTTDLLAHLGVTKADDVPEYATIATELATFEKESRLSDTFSNNGHDGTRTKESEN